MFVRKKIGAGGFNAKFLCDVSSEGRFFMESARNVVMKLRIKWISTFFLSFLYIYMYRLIYFCPTFSPFYRLSTALTMPGADTSPSRCTVIVVPNAH